MNESGDASMPRILLAEDDPVSAAYLGDAATGLPARVDVVVTVVEALARAAQHRHALYLIDAHLPDGRGQDLLQALRAQGSQSPALAHTASSDRQLHLQLRAAGFVEVLCKPLAVVDLLRALRRHLPCAPASDPDPATDHAAPALYPRWDDAAAMAALGGQPSSVSALRALFRAELPGQRHRITQACVRADAATAGDELHRLVASCGFVGASRLAHAVRALQATPQDPAALAAVQAAIDDVLQSA